MINIDNLSVTYNNRQILSNVNMKLEKGSFLLLSGESGSGKTTLLKCLYKEVSDFSGEIEIENKSIAKLKRSQLRKNMGIIFQDFSLLDEYNVIENVILPGKIIGMNKKKAIQRGNELLNKVNLVNANNKFPYQLSGGEKQRVAIARSLFLNPTIILADEPTGNLDSENEREIINIFKNINEESHTTIILVTHSEEIMKNWDKEMLRLENGKFTYERK